MSSEALRTPFGNLLPPLTDEEFEALRLSIESEGVQVPIIVDEDGNIIDGHHRYRIDPNAPRRVVHDLTEPEKRAFSINVNMARRNLNGRQKNELRSVQKEIAVKLKKEGRTQGQVATILGVAQQTVQKWLNTITVNGNGDNPVSISNPTGPFLPDNRFKLTRDQKAEVVERVAAGEKQTKVGADFGVSQSRVSAIIKAHNKPTTPNRAGAYVNVPDDITPEDFCRKGMAMEDSGKTTDYVAKELCVGAQSYRFMRDIVSLSDRNDLSTKDAQSVSSALADMNATSQITRPYEQIEHIAARVWGRGNKGTTRVKTEATRVDAFERAVGVILQACAGAEEIDLPQLSADRAAYFASELENGERYIKALRQRIKEIHQ